MWNLLAYLWLLHFTISNFHMPQPVCVVNWHFNFVFRHISNSLVVDYGTEHRQWLGTTRSGANSAFDSVKCTWWQSHVNGRDSPVKLMNLNAINFHGLLSVSRNSSTICQHWNGIGAREIMATIGNTDIDGDKKIGRSKANQQQNLWLK